MQKLTIRFLIISSFFLIILSCKAFKLQDAVRKESDTKSVKNPFFSDPNKDYVYKTNIEVYGKNLGGIFIAKRLNDTLHRMVLTTDFGNKLLDFELSKNSFKVNFIVEELDKNIIKNILKDDFKMLFKSDFVIEETFEDNNYIIYKSLEENKFTSYLYKKKNNNDLIKIVKASKRKEKVTFEFESENNTFAEKIIITHHNIKLKLSFNQINN